MTMSPFLVALVSAIVSVLFTGATLLANHVTVTTRLTMRIDQLEKESAEYRAFQRSMPENYVPRKEIQVLIDNINAGIKRVEDLLRNLYPVAPPVRGVAPYPPE